MKRCFAVMLTAVFLIAVLSSLALAAETYVIELTLGEMPSLLTTLEGNELGWAAVDYLVSEGWYDCEVFIQDGTEMITSSVGQFYVSYSFVGADTFDPYYSSYYEAPFSFYNGEVICRLGFEFIHGGGLDECLFRLYLDGELTFFDGVTVVFSPASDPVLAGMDSVGAFLSASFDLMISNPLTTTLTAAGLVGVGVTVYTKVKKTARR